MYQAWKIIDNNIFPIKLALDRNDMDCYSAQEVIEMLELAIEDIRDELGE
jgi:hypothetical protein